MNELSNKLKRLREEKGITQKELSEVLNVSSSAYGYYEQNKSEPSVDIIIKLSEYYNVSTDYLLGKSNYKYCVEELLEQINAPNHAELNIKKLKILFTEILLEINNGKLDISDKNVNELITESIHYLEYRLCKIKV